MHAMSQVKQLLFSPVVAPVSRDAEPEPEPEPPEPTHFGRSRSWSGRNGLLGAGAGAVKNGAAPAPKRNAIVEKITECQQ